jgi:hypothetical protein
MNFPKLLALCAISLFLFVAVWKFFSNDSSQGVITHMTPVEIDLDEIYVEPEPVLEDEIYEVAESTENIIETDTVDLTKPIPLADRVEELFSTTGPQLDIVETVSYSKKVPWLRGRPAWLVDYAHHYKTSRYFISRSLAGKPDYFYQKYANGDSFNVLRKDKNISFYIVVDINRSKLWLYALDEDSSLHTLIKTYDACLGRLSNTSSGSLTPTGKYSLGDRVAIYKPGMRDFFNNNKVEMISVFGTRWIPFKGELSDTCTAPAKGLGIHGTPWVQNARTGRYEDPQNNDIGQYESDGCIRLSTADIEELYSIVTSRPSVIELVKDFYIAELPGSEAQAVAMK